VGSNKAVRVTRCIKRAGRALGVREEGKGPLRPISQGESPDWQPTHSEKSMAVLLTHLTRVFSLVNLTKRILDYMCWGTASII